MKYLDFVNELAKSRQDHLTLIGPLVNVTELKEIEQSPIIFIDGGIKILKQLLKIAPDLIYYSIGDGDSAGPEFKGLLDHILDEQKEQTDFNHALHAIPPQIKRMTLLGLSGGEKDQELSILGECYHYMKQNKEIEQIKLAQNLWLYQSRERTILNIKGTFSLFSLEDNLISITGECDYHLLKKTPVKALSSRAFRNFGRGQINVSSDLPLFVYIKE